MADVQETVIIEAKVEGEKDVKKLADAINKSNDEAKKAEKSSKELAKQNEKTAKDGKKGFQGLKNGVKSVGVGFKALGTAMKAAGIGLVIGLVFKLTEAFTQNQQIVDSVNRVFTAINIVFQGVVNSLVDAFNSANKATGGFDALGKVVKGLVTIALTPLKISFNLIKLGIQQAQLAWEQSVFGDDNPETVKRLNEEIKETQKQLAQTAVDAVNAGKDIVTNFGEAFDEVSTFTTTAIDNIKKVSVSASIETANKLVEARKAAELAQVQIQGLIEQYDREAEVLRQQRDEIRNTIDERIRANEELGNVLEKQLQQQLKLAETRVKSAQLEIQATGDNIQNQKALLEAKNEVLAIEAQIEGFRSEQLINEAALQEERRANLEELKKIGLEEAELRKQELQSEFEERQLLIERTIADEEKRKEFILKARKELADGIAAIEAETLAKENEAKEAEKKIDAEKLKAKENKEKEQQQLIMESVGVLAEAVGLGKEFAIAQTLIATFESARKAFNSLAGIPVVGPALGGAAAAAAVVSGLADVKAITSVKTPNVAGAGGGGASGQSAQAPQPPAFNLVGQSNTSAITQPITENEQSPVQAFVVSKNVTTAQQADRNAEQASTF